MKKQNQKQNTKCNKTSDIKGNRALSKEDYGMI